MSRQHGTHVCYVFGSGQGCRCDLCRQAAADYERTRARRIEPAYVCAASARAHLAWLREHGVGLKTVAQLSGISHGALSRLVYGQQGRGPSKRVRPATRDRILAVRPAEGAGGSRVPAGPVWADVERLLGRGWTKVAIARAIGQTGPGLQLGAEVVTRRNARAVTALFDQPVPPQRGRHGLHPVPQREPVDEMALLRDAARRERDADRQRWHRHPDAPVEELRPDPYELPQLVAFDADWMRRAACRGPDVPTWLFFPEPGDRETFVRARAVCATCPVARQCLDAATANGEAGVWGGTSGKQRRQRRVAS